VLNTAYQWEAKAQWRQSAGRVGFGSLLKATACYVPQRRDTLRNLNCTAESRAGMPGIWKVLVALLLSGWIVPVRAQAELNGSYYLPLCRAAVKMLNHSANNNEGPQAMFCLGYLDAARVFLAVTPDPIKSCTPATVTDGQLAIDVVKFLESNPERLTEPFFILVVAALHQAYPCA
jgi:hypothetical protein